MNRHSIALVVVPAVLCTGPVGCAARAPVTEDSGHEVLAVIQELFDAMAAGDAERAGAVLLPDGQWVSVRPGNDQDRVVAVMPHRAFLIALGEAGEAGAEWLERIWDAEVMVHGPIAVVWTPYDFFIDGVFSHCGMDAFTLVRTDDGWRIASATYTVEPTGCPPSPLGPPPSQRR